MKKEKKTEVATMRTEYDFSQAVRNPYVNRTKVGTNLVLIEPDLFLHFPSSEAVNDALRLIVKASSKAMKLKSVKQAKAS